MEAVDVPRGSGIGESGDWTEFQTKSEKGLEVFWFRSRLQGEIMKGHVGWP